jgi:hypothetical protein
MQKEAIDLGIKKAFALCTVRVLSAFLHSAFNILPWKVMAEGVKVRAAPSHPRPSDGRGAGGESTANASANRGVWKRRGI